ncbi:hypothetical protein BOX37_02390 [Nocardia mangyaensis]|uniref:AbiEi antitoxin N-terminal domain-containing protein n=1 Tax=Nocardia mangyaensis TaxID=2213200 RepID=A0A1J0VLW0_9NOCA|nr:type IV toxin-antitoxin system AbiEi family antitoxin domain-containing protein [Nocardia mangyaensis]APE33010.1 hypothetical protein BOX37_02390 [Nocardia mangyaensis]
MKREERMLALADLAGAQWGLFTSTQAAESGFAAQQLKRLADAELISRLRHGVYRLTGAPQTPQDLIRAEWLALEPGRLARDRLDDETPMGVVSHCSAALLQDLGNVDADLHEFTVPRRRGTRSHDVKFHVRELAQQDWHLVAGLPVTRPLRTVVDLAAARTDGGHLATIVRDAILTNDTTRDELAEALRPYAHHYGMALGAGHDLVRSFIGQAGVPESALSLTRPDLAADFAFTDGERRFLAQVKAFMDRSGPGLGPRLNERLGVAGQRGFAPGEDSELTSFLLSLGSRTPAELQAVWALVAAIAGDESKGIAAAGRPVGLEVGSRSARSGFDHDDDNRGGDERSGEEVSDRSRVPAGDQRSDREAGA